MATEIELKVRVDGFDGLAERLRAVAATHVADMFEINAFYDAPDESLQRGDRGLRLRHVQTNGGPSRTEMTYKGPRADGPVKRRTEIEIEVSDIDGAADMLDALGYQRMLRFEKRRSRYRLDGCLVELDELPRLGRFIEIEGPTEAAVTELQNKLGLGDLPTESRGYATLLREHAEMHGLDTEYIQFAESSKVL